MNHITVTLHLLSTILSMSHDDLHIVMQYHVLAITFYNSLTFRILEALSAISCVRSVCNVVG